MDAKLFITASKHKGPNIYTICLMCGGPVFISQLMTVVQPQENDPLAKDTDPVHSHHYGTRSKAWTSTVTETSCTNEDIHLETGYGSLVKSLLESWL